MFNKGDTVQDIYTDEIFVVKSVCFQDYAGKPDATVTFEPTESQPTPWNKGSNLRLIKRAEHKCDQCGEDLGNEWLLGPVCGKCCRKNHKRVAGR